MLQKKCFHVLAEDDRRYCVRTKTSIQLQERRYIESRCEANLTSIKLPEDLQTACLPTANPGHISSTRVRRVESKPNSSSVPRRGISLETSDALRVQTQKDT